MRALFFFWGGVGWLRQPTTAVILHLERTRSALGPGLGRQEPPTMGFGVCVCVRDTLAWLPLPAAPAPCHPPPTPPQVELVSGLARSVAEAAGALGSAGTPEGLELVFGAMGALGAGRPERLDAGAQESLLGLGRGLLGDAVGGGGESGGRVAVTGPAAAAACAALAPLLASDGRFGPAGATSTHNSEARGRGLDQLASGTLVGRFAGMGPAETACPGLLVSALKVEGGALPCLLQWGVRSPRGAAPGNAAPASTPFFFLSPSFSPGVLF